MWNIWFTAHVRAFFGVVNKMVSILPQVIIGDIQGCEVTLRALLKQCEMSLGDCEFLMLGDLVNRGPSSLGVIQLMRERDYASVLGNHELYLLGVYANLMSRSKDTLDDVWHAPDLAEMVDWIRGLPILRRIDQGLLVHAGVSPNWSEAQTLDYAHRIEMGLRGDNWQLFLSTLLGAKAKTVAPQNENRDLAQALKVFTRIRFIKQSGELDHKFKGPPEDAPESLTPWYQDYTGGMGCVFFGHWAALGARRLRWAVSLDSGCVWGRGLTAYVPHQNRFIYQQSLEL